MTALRAEAINLIEEIPEENMIHVIHVLKNYRSTMEKNTPERLTKSQAAYRNLLKYQKESQVDIDYKKELADAIEEKYESIR